MVHKCNAEYSVQIGGGAVCLQQHWKEIGEITGQFLINVVFTQPAGVTLMSLRWKKIEVGG